MLSSCVKTVESLLKVSGQIKYLYTKSTAWFVLNRGAKFLPTVFATKFAQIISPFTQLVLANFSLLVLKLYPISTPTMITTNLINKE